MSSPSRAPALARFPARPSRAPPAPSPALARFPAPLRASRRAVSASALDARELGAGEERARDDARARDDDARQYGVWGVDGIRQRSASFAAMEEDWEAAVASVWARAGASEVATQRLLILGAAWQKAPESGIYRDPDAVAYVVDSLRTLLPGADPAKIFHAQPAVASVCMDRAVLSQRLVAVRSSVRMPPLDVALVVTKEPSLLLLDAAESRERCAAAADALRAKTAWLLDERGVASVAEVCPSLLTHEPEDVSDAFDGFRAEVYERLDGVKGWSAKLLAEKPRTRKYSRDEEDATGPGRGDAVEDEDGERRDAEEERRRSALDGGGTPLVMKNNTVARRESGSNLRGDRGGCCWESLGDDAKAAARRASVDYAGRVAEPSLRRARVRREREGARGG